MSLDTKEHAFDRLQVTEVQDLGFSVYRSSSVAGPFLPIAMAPANSTRIDATCLSLSKPVYFH